MHLTAIGIALDQFRRDHGANPPDLRALCTAGYVTDDSLLICTKTGAPYFYDPKAAGNETFVSACCRPTTASGKRPHSQHESFVGLQLGGKLVEVGR